MISNIQLICFLLISIFLIIFYNLIHINKFIKIILFIIILYITTLNNNQISNFSGSSEISNNLDDIINMQNNELEQLIKKLNIDLQNMTITENISKEYSKLIYRIENMINVFDKYTNKPNLHINNLQSKINLLYKEWTLKLEKNDLNNLTTIIRNSQDKNTQKINNSMYNENIDIAEIYYLLNKN